MDLRWVAPATLLIICWLGFIGLLTGHDPVRLPLLTLLGDTNGEMRFTTVSALESLDVRLSGKVEFSDDDRAIRGMSDGGRLEIRYRDGLQRRRLVVRPDSGGGVRYEYDVRGQDREFDDEGREWLAELLPRIIRESGIGAEARVARILARDGVAGVLEEIDRIESSSAAVRYCSELREQGDLDSEGRRTLVRRCSDSIASSGDRARFLIAAAGDYVTDPEAVESFFSAVDAVPSSGDHARVLIRVLEDERPLEPEVLARASESASGIASSGDRARVLIRAAPLYDNHEAVRRAFFDAASSIPSSGDHARVLIALSRETRLDASSLAEFFRSAQRIASSGDKARVLIVAAPGFVNEEPVRQAFFRAADSIAGSGDRARALLGLLDRAEPDRESMRGLLRCASGIPSSGDKRRVLVHAAGRVAGDESLREAYLEAAATIASSGDRDRARSAVLP